MLTLILSRPPRQVPLPLRGAPNSAEFGVILRADWTSGLQKCNECTGSCVQTTGNYVATPSSGHSVAEVLREFDELDCAPFGHLSRPRRWSSGRGSDVGGVAPSSCRSNQAESQSPSRRLSRGNPNASLDTGRRACRWYAEGALDRALHPVVVRTRVAGVPLSERPTPGQ